MASVSTKAAEAATMPAGADTVAAGAATDATANTADMGNSSTVAEMSTNNPVCFSLV